MLGVKCMIDALNDIPIVEPDEIDVSHPTNVMNSRTMIAKIIMSFTRLRRVSVKT